MSGDGAAVRESAQVLRRGDVGHEPVKWRCQWRVEKRNGYPDEWGDTRPDPYEVVEGEGNLLMTVGAKLLWQALVGTAITAFSNANANLGVGDSSTAAAAGQTDLQAATNKTRVAMNAGYPKAAIAGGAAADNQVIFQSDFTAANYVWNEWAVFNAAAAGSMLNRVVAALGTKASGTWTLTVTLSLA